MIGFWRFDLVACILLEMERMRFEGMKFVMEELYPRKVALVLSFCLQIIIA